MKNRRLLVITIIFALSFAIFDSTHSRPALAGGGYVYSCATDHFISGGTGPGTVVININVNNGDTIYAAWGTGNPGTYSIGITYPGGSTSGVNGITAIATGSGIAVVTFNGTAGYAWSVACNVPGPYIPGSFVLRTITCNTPLYQKAGGDVISSGEKVTAGQTWFVNPVPMVVGKSSWTEIFVGAYNNGYLPTSCVS